MSVTGLSALEAVFSCGVCFASYSEIYKDDDSFVDTLSDPGLSLRGVVPKLWMTSCGHVICGKHLEGGGYKGAPFHPMGVDIMTKCTVCDREFGEKGKVALYPIWGVTDGFYDPRLPKAFFQVPPIKFDKIYVQPFGQGRQPSRQEREANENAREALRFQFISLTYYAKGIRGRLSEAEDKLWEYKHQLMGFKEENVQLLKSLLHQREEYSDKLAVLEEEKSTWQQKKRMAIHYVSLVGALADENAKLKQQLVSLGIPVEDTHYTFDESEIKYLTAGCDSLGATIGRNTNGGDTTIPEGRGNKSVSKFVDHVRASHPNGDIRSFSDPKKRKYLSSGDDLSSKTRSAEDLRNIRRQLSRDSMPPPPLPHGSSRERIALRAENVSSSVLPVRASVVSTSQTPVGQGVARSSGLTDWPFTGRDQIDATRGQTAQFPKPQANRVYRLGSMEWERNDLELSSVFSKRNAPYTSDGNTNGTASLRPLSNWAIDESCAGSQAGVIAHGQPAGQTIAQSQNRHDSSPQQLTEESLATLKEQLRRTTSYDRRRNRQHAPPVSEASPSLNLNHPNLGKCGGVLAGTTASEGTPQSPMRNSRNQQNSVERVHDIPFLDRGSSYNGESCSVSDATAYDLQVSERGPLYNISHDAGPISHSAAVPNNDAINLIPISPKESPDAINRNSIPRKRSSRPLTSLSVAPTWLRGLSKTSSGASNSGTQSSIMRTSTNSQSRQWLTQNQKNSVNTPNPHGQTRLSIGTARGLVSKSGRWICNLASRGQSVSSPFFKRNNTGTPRRPSPTMEESESYEVYQRFRTNDHLRTGVSQRNIVSSRSSVDRDTSASRSAAIRDHIFGPTAPENYARAAPSFCRPFTPHYVSPSMAPSETGFGYSRMAPPSGQRIARH